MSQVREKEEREGGRVGRREGGREDRGKRNTVNDRLEWCTHIQLSEVAQCKSHTCMSSFKASSLFLSLPNESVIKPGHRRVGG